MPFHRPSSYRHFAIFLALAVIPPARAEEPASDAGRPPTILFLGDSITAAGGYVRTIEAELAKQHPDRAPKVINRGRSSETVSDLSEAYHPGRRPCVLARIDEELKQHKPAIVVACYGINCGIYHPFSQTRFEAYQAGVAKLVKTVQATGTRIVLLTPPPYANPGPPFPDGASEEEKEKIVAEVNAAAEADAQKDPNKYGYRTPYVYYDRVLARYAAWLLTLDGKEGVSVVDLRGPMLARSGETHGRDAIHPNGTGHAIMAEAFLKRWPAIEAQGKEK